MTTHMTGTRDEWLAARLALLKEEKEFTRRGDELAQRRQELPWVRVDKAYRFETDEGNVSLVDLFKGRSQLLVYHFMFGPDYKAGRPSCSAIADGFNGIAVHLANHDVTFSAVSRAPLAKLQAYKRRMGWTFPWASSLGGDFNFDFNVSLTEEQQRKGAVEYNYRREAAWTVRGIGDSMTKRGEGPVAEMAAMTGRPRTQGAQRGGHLVAPPRRIRVTSSKRRLVLPRGGGACVSTRHGCQTATRDRDNAHRPASRWSRGDEIAGWTVPSATFLRRARRRASRLIKSGRQDGY